MSCPSLRTGNTNRDLPPLDFSTVPTKTFRSLYSHALLIKIKWCMNRSLKIPYIAHASLAHMVRRWTPKPAIISCIRSSPTGGNFFSAVVKSFEYKIAISANFVQTVKNSTVKKRVFHKLPAIQECQYWQLRFACAIQNEQDQ